MMGRSTKEYLLGGTSLLTGFKMIPVDQIVSKYTGISMSGFTITNAQGGGGAAFQVNQPVRCPRLTDEILIGLDSDVPATITRHIEEEYFAVTQSGSFYFGTIASYAPDDASLTSGRLGDGQEGSQQEIFSSRSGLYEDTIIGGIRLTDVRVQGMDGVKLSYTVNDYCSCSSLGDFDVKRAIHLRNQNNPTLNCYVTYDVVKLKAALEMVLKEMGRGNLRLFGRKVIYGKKDRKWEIEEKFSHKEERDPLAIYLGTVAVKSPAYEHEDEYRLLLIDPEQPGSLPRDTGYLFLKDHRFAEAIVACGSF